MMESSSALHSDCSRLFGLSTDTLIDFLNTFNFTKDQNDKTRIQINSVGDAANVLVIWNCMHEIYPEWFDLQIHPTIYHNKIAAYNVLLQYINEYHEYKYEKEVDYFIDKANEILEDKDETLTKSLYALVVLSLINSDDQSLIERIFSLNEASQLEIQDFITNLAEMTENKKSSLHLKADKISKKFDSNDEESFLENNLNIDGIYDFHSLQNLVRDLKQKVKILEIENLSLTKKCSKVEKEEKQNYSPETTQKKDDMLKYFSSQNEEMDKEINDLKNTIEIERKKKKEIEEKLTEEIHDLKDEIDLLRHQTSKVSHLENQISKQKAKLDEMILLKNQIRELEEKNHEYVNKVLEMESQSKNTMNTKKMLESYKDKLADYEVKVSTLMKEKEGHEKLIIELKEKLQFVEKSLALKENEILVLKSDLESKDLDLQEMRNNQFYSTEDGTKNIHETLRRLEKENSILKKSTEQSDESQKIITLANELDDVRRVRDKLEKNLENVTSKLTYLQLQMQNNNNNVNVEQLEELIQKTKDLQNQNADLNAEIKLLRTDKDGLTNKLMELMENQKPSSSDELLLAKYAALEAQLEAQKEKLENQKVVTQSHLERRFELVIDKLKEQLQIRERETEYYKKALEEQQDCNRRENRLISSAFHQIALRYHQLNLYCEQMKNELDAIQMSTENDLRVSSPLGSNLSQEPSSDQPASKRSDVYDLSD